MPTSVRGNKASAGFTLIEVMVVMTIIAIGVGLASLALRDRAGSRLEEEAVRLAALLDGARAESRMLGVDVRWYPRREPSADQPRPGFRFEGLPARAEPRPNTWLEPDVQAEVVDAPLLRLGPEPIIGAQRVLLHLDGQKIMLGTDGLAPFHILAAAADAP